LWHWGPCWRSSLCSAGFSRKATLTPPPGKPNALDLDFLRGLIEEGRLKPVIEAGYSLDKIAEAHRHVERNRPKGKIAVEVRSR